MSDFVTLNDGLRIPSQFQEGDILLLSHFVLDEARIEIDGQWHDVTQQLGDSPVPINPTFYLEFLAVNPPEAEALTELYGESSDTPVRIEIKGGRFYAAGTFTYEAEDFITLDDGVMKVLPLRCTWVERKIVIK